MIATIEPFIMWTAIVLLPVLGAIRIWVWHRDTKYRRDYDKRLRDRMENKS